MSSLAKTLRDFRIKTGLSQAKVGELMGISQSAVSKWERGENQPRMRHLKKLAQVFGTTATALVAVAEYVEDQQDSPQDEPGAKLDERELRP